MDFKLNFSQGLYLVFWYIRGSIVLQVCIDTSQHLRRGVPELLEIGRYYSKFNEVKHIERDEGGGKGILSRDMVEGIC
ncbi:hypothetical protein K1720_03645 [Thermococcus argininiproducens]|uniref:Uncharacterized protein n=1 Tax=Thermococcus argininiproducens TaxID=2866384 RepID=A0A9E7MAY0_9EURY|nr:hypothetical protein [Thermococcus argininiproducens]USH00556.1 hypothetical protein K1720_03645 [Thermococcus argininiproducens]